MKVYQDLTIKGSRQALDRFVGAVEERLVDGWKRNHETEREVRAAFGPMYCFTCSASGARPHSELWIATHSNGTLYVTNILAREFASLTYDQYNAILREFHDRFAIQAAMAAGVKIELGNPDPQIEDFLSASAAAALRSFSGLANRAMLHPYDRKRWNEFLTLAYREAAPLRDRAKITTHR